MARQKLCQRCLRYMFNDVYSGKKCISMRIEMKSGIYMLNMSATKHPSGNLSFFFLMSILITRFL